MPYRVCEADWEVDNSALKAIRHTVFVIEQAVPEALEWDGEDAQAKHFLAFDRNDAPIGTARLLNSGQIGRMAVLINHRGSGIGAALLATAEATARNSGMDETFLHAQIQAIGFYEKSGYTAYGETFMGAGIAHVAMRKHLK